jgi:catechol 2,3-dioxygenase-like lactoylglutathione lyase family enzyme
VSTFQVDQLDHVELFVPNRHEAAAWYRSVLGLEVVSDYEHWAEARGGPLMISSDRGNTMLALFEGPPSGPPSAEGFRRVAFRVRGGGFIEFLKRLGDLGLHDHLHRVLTVDLVVDHGQAYSLYFSDPYGHLFELTTYDHETVAAQLVNLRARPR